MTLKNQPAVQSYLKTPPVLREMSPLAMVPQGPSAAAVHLVLHSKKLAVLQLCDLQVAVRLGMGKMHLYKGWFDALGRFPSFVERATGVLQCRRDTNVVSLVHIGFCLLRRNRPLVSSE